MFTKIRARLNKPQLSSTGKTPFIAAIISIGRYFNIDQTLL